MSSHSNRISTNSDIVWDAWEENRRKTISFENPGIVFSLPNTNQVFYRTKNSIDVPNRRSILSTNSAFIFDELEVVEDDFVDVCDGKRITAPVSAKTNVFKVTSFKQCVKHVYRMQGFRSFWNGNLANCLRNHFKYFDSEEANSTVYGIAGEPLFEIMAALHSTLEWYQIYLAKLFIAA